MATIGSAAGILQVTRSITFDGTIMIEPQLLQRPQQNCGLINRRLPCVLRREDHARLRHMERPLLGGMGESRFVDLGKGLLRAALERCHDGVDAGDGVAQGLRVVWRQLRALCSQLGRQRQSQFGAVRDRWVSLVNHQLPIIPIVLPPSRSSPSDASQEDYAAGLNSVRGRDQCRGAQLGRLTD